MVVAWQLGDSEDSGDAGWLLLVSSDIMALSSTPWGSSLQNTRGVLKTPAAGDPLPRTSRRLLEKYQHGIRGCCANVEGAVNAVKNEHRVPFCGLKEIKELSFLWKHKICDVLKRSVSFHCHFHFLNERSFCASANVSPHNLCHPTTLSGSFPSNKASDSWS